MTYANFFNKKLRARDYNSQRMAGNCIRGRHQDAYNLEDAALI